MDTPPVDSTELANRLRPVLLHLNRHLRREVHRLGVSATQVSLLAAICDRPGIGVNELAQREGTSAPAMSGQVDKLEAAGLVERQRDRETDRRRIGLRVTSAGHRVLRAVRSGRTAWLASRLQAVSPQERERIASAVDALAALVHQA